MIIKIEFLNEYYGRKRGKEDRYCTAESELKRAQNAVVMECFCWRALWQKSRIFAQFDSQRIIQQQKEDRIRDPRKESPVAESELTRAG